MLSQQIVISPADSPYNDGLMSYIYSSRILAGESGKPANGKEIVNNH
jgi:hypothetical protein